MVMYGILDVDEKCQTVTSHIWIETHWKNEFLTWNPSDFCGMDKLTIPKSLVWNPDVGIDEDTSDSGSIREDPLLILMSSGEAVTTTRQRLTSTCQLNLLLFPFDVQRCNITFSSTSFDTSSLKLGTARNSSVITSLSDEFMITQGEWNLKNMQVFLYDQSNGNISVSKLRYTVWLERKPMLYVINLILPLFYLLILDLASFFISESSGEKLGFKVTILLSISVLLLILNDILPSTEDKLPMIASYCVSVFTVVWLSVLEAMLVGYLSKIDGFCCKEDQSSGDLQQDAVRHEEPAEVQEDTKAEAVKTVLPPDGLQDLLKGILDEVRAAQREAGRRDKPDAQEGRFRRLAKTIDCVFFLLYFLVVVTFLLYLCIIWMNG
ncbi:5-hydroxytryptamine receptor 3A isoform X2 [Oryzias latipes]